VELFNIIEFVDEHVAVEAVEKASDKDSTAVPAIEEFTAAPKLFPALLSVCVPLRDWGSNVKAKAPARVVAFVKFKHTQEWTAWGGGKVVTVVK